MNIKFIGNFIKLTRYKNFSELARDLAISQSTLSHQITQLEKELDVVLIDRTTKKFILTEKGKIFLEYGTKIVDLYDTCVQQLSVHAEDMIENIVISASTLPGSHLLLKFITRFKEKNPNVNFQILINNSQKSIDLLLKGMADFAGIGSFMNQNRNQFDYFKIGVDQLTLICSPNHHLIKGGKYVVDFEDLIKYPFIFREKGSGTRNVIEQEFPELERLNIKLEINDNDSIVSAVSESNYLSILSEFFAKKAEDAGLIKIIKIKDFPELAKRNIFFVKLKKKHQSEMKKIFWENLKT